MKVVIQDELIILYLNKLYIKNLNFSDKEMLQTYLRKLLLKLHTNYGLEINGYYDITIYIDQNYGVIMEVKKEELEYLDYFGKTLEINTKIINDSFLYEVSDVEYFNKYHIFNNHLYISLDKPISNINMGRFLEKVIKIIYGKERKKISK